MSTSSTRTLPGARAVPEVVADAALEPVPDALDGELVSEEEYARRSNT